MKKTLRRIALLVSGMGAGYAQALPIITVGTQEWLQPKDFLNLSWNDIAGVCTGPNGVCSDAPLGSTNMSGWTWASNNDMNALFNSVAGTMFSFDYSYEVGALDAFLPLFTNIGFDLTYVYPPVFNGISGFIRSSQQVSPSLETYVGIASVDSCNDAQGGRCSMDTVSVDLSPQPELQRPEVGGWFFRSASSSEVPVPATLPLVGLSLVAVGYSRRFRKINA